MDKLRAMQLFVRLAELGSFTKVAEEANSSKSMVSKEISRLEESIGARLLHRSTRNLQLTTLGEDYLQSCRKILMEMEEADARVQDQQARPRGMLRINAPMALGLTDLSTMFVEFMRQYPEIELDIHLGDEAIDLVAQGFDLGFRASSQPFDTSYVGKELTRFKYQVCATPEYLQNAAALQRPDDLVHHNCFVYSYFRSKTIWPLDDGVAISGNLKVNNTLFMRQFVLEGLGVGFLPDFVAREGLAEGRLVEVLADVKRPELTLFALYPSRHLVPPRLSCCVEFMQRWFEA